MPNTHTHTHKHTHTLTAHMRAHACTHLNAEIFSASNHILVGAQSVGVHGFTALEA